MASDLQTFVLVLASVWVPLALYVARLLRLHRELSAREAKRPPTGPN